MALIWGTQNEYILKNLCVKKILATACTYLQVRNKKWTLSWGEDQHIEFVLIVMEVEGVHAVVYIYKLEYRSYLIVVLGGRGRRDQLYQRSRSIYAFKLITSRRTIKTTIWLTPSWSSGTVGDDPTKNVRMEASFCSNLLYNMRRVFLHVEAVHVIHFACFMQYGWYVVKGKKITMVMCVSNCPRELNYCRRKRTRIRTVISRSKL